MRLHLAQGVHIGHKVYNVRQPAFKVGSASTLDRPRQGELKLWHILEDGGGWKFSFRILEHHAAQEEKVDIRNGGLILERVNKLVDNSTDYGRLVPLLVERFVAAATDFYQVL